MKIKDWEDTVTSFSTIITWKMGAGERNFSRETQGEESHSTRS